MAARVASYHLRNDFVGEKVTVDEVSYSEESDMPRLDMRGSTVIMKCDLKNNRGKKSLFRSKSKPIRLS